MGPDDRLRHLDRPGVHDLRPRGSGHCVQLGTGIHLEPHVELGDDVQVASNSVIITSVPAGHAVKRRMITTTVLPQR
ncbi:MAG: hypothetical protein JO287_06890 [Pseudonocardiales bacterium]|nr:hypothetical protein [Pseudonocardiales bacterium]